MRGPSSRCVVRLAGPALRLARYPRMPECPEREWFQVSIQADLKNPMSTLGQETGRLKLCCSPRLVARPSAGSCAAMVGCHARIPATNRGWRSTLRALSTFRSFRPRSRRRRSGVGYPASGGATPNEAPPARKHRATGKNPSGEPPAAVKILISCIFTRMPASLL
jgi:hypothetical protein